MTLDQTCPNCRKSYKVTVDDDAFHLWWCGELAQNAFPHMTSEEREQLISGICSNECWDEYMGVEA